MKITKLNQRTGLTLGLIVLLGASMEGALAGHPIHSEFGRVFDGRSGICESGVDAALGNAAYRLSQPRVSIDAGYQRMTVEIEAEFFVCTLAGNGTVFWNATPYDQSVEYRMPGAYGEVLQVRRSVSRFELLALSADSKILSRSEIAGRPGQYTGRFEIPLGGQVPAPGSRMQIELLSRALISYSVNGGREESDGYATGGAYVLGLEFEGRAGRGVARVAAFQRR